MISFLMPVIEESVPDSALSAVVKAHALSSFAHSVHDSSVAEVAFWQYNNSIRRIRCALAEDALADDTLLAVRLLGHVEVCEPSITPFPGIHLTLCKATTGFGTDSLNHFFGMISLITHRGTSRIKTARDVTLFRQLRISTVPPHPLSLFRYPR